MGRKAALWGAILGMLPDLDELIPFGDPVADFTFHRSFSHSVFMLAVLTPLMVKTEVTLNSTVRGNGIEPT